MSGPIPQTSESVGLKWVLDVHFWQVPATLRAGLREPRAGAHLVFAQLGGEPLLLEPERWARPRPPAPSSPRSLAEQMQTPRTAPHPRGGWVDRAHLHGKGLAAAGVLAHEGALLLMEGEDVALEVEGGGVGAATACPWTPAHVPAGGMRPHVLPQEFLAFKRFLAHATPYVLWGSRR